MSLVIANLDKLDSSFHGEESENFASDILDIPDNPPKQLNPSQLPNNNTSSPQTIPPKQTKSVFSKLSEELFDSIRNSNPNNPLKYNFDSFVNEQLILQYSEKFNEGNKDKIKCFLERTKQQIEKKKLSSIESSSNNKTVKKTPTAATTTNTQAKVKKFLNEQNLFLEKKKKNLQSMKKRLYTEEKENNTAVPIINQNSIAIVNKKRKDNTHINVFNKLHEDNKNKIKQNILTSPTSCRKDVARSFVVPSSTKAFNNHNKKISPSEMNEIINNLHKPKSRSKSKSFSGNALLNNNGSGNGNESDLTSNSSNNLLMQRFLKNYDVETNNMFNTRSDVNFDLTFREFVLLVHKLGFVVKNYEQKLSTFDFNSNNNQPTQTPSSSSSSSSPIEKEFQLLIDAWKVISRHKDINQTHQQIKSYNVLLFLLCILDLYKGTSSPLLQKNLPFIPLNSPEYTIKPALAKQIKIFFRLFFNNEMDFLFKQNSKPQPQHHPHSHPYTSSSSINTNKPSSTSTITNNTNKKRPSLLKSYDVFIKKKENTLERLRTEKQTLELKECTFFPNNTKPKSRSVSTEVTNRLYAPTHHHKQQQLKQPTEQDKLNSIDGGVCSFSPMLSTMNPKMFNYNPIKDDKNVNERIEQYEKARIDKKLNNYLLKQGTHSISHLKTFDEVVNDIARTEPPTNFRFDNEYRGYKNTFDKFNKSNKRNSDKNKNEKEVKYVFEIKVEDQIKALKIYKGDNIEKNVDKFCYDNNLELESKEQIMSAIKDKIEQN